MQALDTLIGTLANELQERIWQAGSITEKIKILDSFLHQRKKERYAKEQLVNRIVYDLKDTESCRTIADLADRYSLSYKQLERLFQTYIGLSPKLYMRILRFNKTFRTFHQNQGQNRKLVDVAYNTGYFDQNHYIKEVKAFSGLTPSQLYSKKLHPIEAAQWKYMAGVD